MVQAHRMTSPALLLDLGSLVKCVVIIVNEKHEADRPIWQEIGKVTIEYLLQFANHLEKVNVRSSMFSLQNASQMSRYQV